MGRTLSWLANSVLFVVCCYLVADAANEVFAALLTPTADEISEAPSGPAVDARRSWSDREVILSRNLFNASLLAPPPPPVVEEEPEEEEELVETKLPLQLLGTAAATPVELSWAAVHDEVERRTVIVRATDKIQTATVDRIERRRIVLIEDGERRELALDEDEATAPRKGPRARPGKKVRRAAKSKNRIAAARNAKRARARPTPPKPPSKPKAAPEPEVVRKLDEDEFEMDRDDVDDMVRNPSNLFSQARILPKYQEGEMVGLQINAIKPGSLFENIGIQSGDVITSLNGIAIDDPQESAQVLAEFSEADSFTVDVERSDGSTDTLEFNLEDSE